MAISTIIRQPDPVISHFVDSFWMLYNDSDECRDAIVVPDGRIDLFVIIKPDQPPSIKLLGLGTFPSEVKIVPRCLIFSVSFNPIAAEYIIGKKVAGILDSACTIESPFWDFPSTAIENFDQFYFEASRQIIAKLPIEVDPRKKKLFDLVFSTKGAISISTLSDELCWTSRQLNRYFTDHFGISLKAYCGIIRFRTSLHHLKKGKLCPEGNFSDQPHFIREVKKLAGVSPKALAKNENDRFVQFFALPKI